LQQTSFLLASNTPDLLDELKDSVACIVHAASQRPHCPRTSRERAINSCLKKVPSSQIDEDSKEQFNRNGGEKKEKKQQEKRKGEEKRDAQGHAKRMARVHFFLSSVSHFTCCF